MAYQVYQALLARPESVAHVRQAQRAIERVGGKIVIEPPSPQGMVFVVLTLPDPFVPADFFLDLPFYPM